MEAALGWIGGFVEWLIQFLPRVTWVEPTHGAIAFTRGKHVRTYGPGLAGRWFCPMWWPAWTSMTLYPVVRQTQDMAPQTLTTSDRTEVMVAGVIVYRITDLEKAMTAQYDLEDTIADISAVALANFVRAHSFDAVHEEDGSTLKVAIQKSLQRYGIGISDAGITDFARTKHITVAGSNLVIGGEEEE